MRRIPAGEVEQLVVQQLRNILRSPEVLAHAVREVRTLRPDIPEAKAIDALQSIDAVWEELFPAEQARIIQTVIKQITVRKDGLSIEWLVDGMTGLLRSTVDEQPARRAA